MEFIYLLKWILHRKKQGPILREERTRILFTLFNIVYTYFDYCTRTNCNAISNGIADTGIYTSNRLTHNVSMRDDTEEWLDTEAKVNMLKEYVDDMNKNKD
jgi:hypothetical protein